MRTQNEMKAMEKQVYNFLVSKANEHGYYIFNQLAYSRKYGVSEKTVRRITQRLVDKGAIINHGPGVSENVVYGSLGIIVEIKNHKPPKPTTDSNVTDELPQRGRGYQRHRNIPGGGYVQMNLFENEGWIK